jgi:hypothetical protein
MRVRRVFIAGVFAAGLLVAGAAGVSGQLKPLITDAPPDHRAQIPPADVFAALLEAQKLLDTEW